MTDATTHPADAEDIKPPVTEVGVVGWIKTNLFNGWFNSLLTIVTLLFLWYVVPPLVRWAFLDAAWNTTGMGCRDAAGACWSGLAGQSR